MPARKPHGSTFLKSGGRKEGECSCFFFRSFVFHWSAFAPCPRGFCSSASEAEPSSCKSGSRGWCRASRSPGRAGLVPGRCPCRTAPGAQASPGELGQPPLLGVLQRGWERQSIPPGAVHTKLSLRLFVSEAFSFKMLILVYITSL